MENAILSNIRQDMSKVQLSGLGIPAIVLLIISMLILPLPSLLDFYSFNILLGVTIIMIAINSSTLDFSAFSTILLIATMLSRIKCCLYTLSTCKVTKAQMPQGR